MNNKSSYYDKTQFCLKHHFKQFYICNKKYFTPALQKLLENPDDFFHEKILKEEKTFIDTTTVALTHIDDRYLVIKRYNIKNFFHGLKQAIRPSRAARCWYYSHLLQTLDINTPHPIAMIEKRFGPFRRQAYFITEYLEGEDGFSIFRDNPADSEKTQIYAGNIIKLIKQLHANLITHGDLKATNFIFQGHAPFLIDLDATQQHKNHTKAKRKLNRDRRIFALNWENLPVKKFFENF